MAYVYTHTLEGANRPFYVGVGSDKKYIRAFTRTGRTKAWEEVALSNDFRVDIISDNLTWLDACLLESELIMKHGRQNNNTGLLVNKNNGGKARELKEEQKDVLTLRILPTIKSKLLTEADQGNTTISRLVSKILINHYAKDENTIENKQVRKAIKSSSIKGSNTKGRP
jgi:hypothetical protein